MCIVIMGTPIDGFRYFGPFDSFADALAWIDNGPTPDEPYWIVTLETPLSPH